MSTQTSQASRRSRRGGFGPRHLAGYATAHPKRVVRIWGLLPVLGMRSTEEPR